MTHHEFLNLIRSLGEAGSSSGEWLSKTRARVLSAVELQPLAVEPISFTWPKLATAALAIFLIIAVSGAGAALASQNDLPGGSLYGMKLFLEQMQISRTPQPVEKARLVLRQASLRLSEVAEAAKKQVAPEHIKAALDNYEEKLAIASEELKGSREKGDSEAVKEVATAISLSFAEHQQAISDLENTVQPLPETAAALANAQKLAAESDELAVGALFELKAKEDESAEETSSASATAETPEEVAAAIDAELEPKEPIVIQALTPKVDEPKPTSSLLIQAVEKFDSASRRLSELKMKLLNDTSGLAKDDLVVFNEGLVEVEAKLALAKEALRSNDAKSIFSHASGAIIKLIELETSYKLALLQPADRAELEALEELIEPAAEPPVEQEPAAEIKAESIEKTPVELKP